MADRQLSAVRLLISGRVQGVSYRFWTERTARDLGLKGWVRNLLDGRVEVFAEGDPDALFELYQRCLSGPPSARVEGVEREARPAQDLSSFEIERTAREPS